MSVVRDDGSSSNFGENAWCACKNDRPAGCCVFDILFGYVARVIGQLKCFLGFGPQLTIKLVIEAPSSSSSSSSNCDTNDQRPKSADRRGRRTRCKRPEPECQALECPELDPCRPAGRKPKKCECSKRSCSGDRWKCDGDGRRKNNDFGKSDDGDFESLQQDKIVVNRICDKLSSIITKMCCMLETLADVPCVPGSACQHSDASRTKCVESAEADCPCEDVPTEPADNKPARCEPEDNEPKRSEPADKKPEVPGVEAPRKPVVDPKAPRSERAAKSPATKPAANPSREHKRVIPDKSVSDKLRDGECSRNVKQNNSRSRAEIKKELIA